MTGTTDSGNKAPDAATADAAASPHRLERALVAFVRQDISAPVGAIVGFAEILLEDAKRQGSGELVPDLQKIHDAGVQLQDLLATLLEPKALAARIGSHDFEAFRGKLRHDLRTPLNGVKGYAEMVLEDAGDGHNALVHDLTKLLGAANALLGRIDALADFNADAIIRPGATLREAAASDLVSRVIASIQPVSTGDTGAPIVSSRILVVDDTESNRDLLSRRLVREGHVVESVADGRAALERLAADSFDLVLLDLMMPGMNGFEALCRIKAEPRTRHVPVIMISALDEFDSIVRCIEAGAEDYLPKPFNPVLLRARLNASLDKKRLRDREQSVLEELRVERDKSEALLANILPRTIIARMRKGETEIADRFNEVTILFADLVGFTSLATHYPPSRVVELLNELFTEFDRLAAERGLEKIKTIGDAYMVAGGIPEPHDDHAHAIADMALAMLDVVRLAGEEFGELLRIRVGIHTGAAVAGIIGKNKFIYDVWGDTVNTASRMESHGEPDRIHLSASTYLRIRDAYECEARGPLAIKGKGLMETYFLARKIGG
jgi:class 3 adenylate cyclase